MAAQPFDALLVGYENQENLGLRYIAAYLIDKGYRVAIQPFSPDIFDGVIQAALTLRPALIGFSLIFQYTLPEFGDLLTALRREKVNAHMTAGGHYPSLRPQQTLDHLPQLDSIVRFEGEETLRELLDAIESGADWRSISGIAFRDRVGIHQTRPRPLIEPLDALPWPLRGPLDPDSAQEPFRAAPMLASRGCLYDCAFCSIREFYRGAPGAPRRSRSPQDVAAEMKHLYDTYNTRVFLFQDDDFALRGQKAGEWTRLFLAALDDNELSGKIAWKISSRVDDIADPQLLAQCRERGLLAVYLGIESGNPDGMVTLNKRATVEQNLQAIYMLKEQSIAFDLGFMLFDPDSSFERVAANLDFLEKIADIEGLPLAFVKMLPLAGTAIERRLQQEGRLVGPELRPNYRLTDPRLEYFALFTTLAFTRRNSDPEGFVERFRRAYFIALLAERFGGGREASLYRRSVAKLIRRGNRSALSLLRNALELTAEQPDARGVALVWPQLRSMADAEEEKWTNLLQRLEALGPTFQHIMYMNQPRDIAHHNNSSQ